MLSTPIMTVKNKNFYFLFLDDERIPDNVTWIELPKVDWIIVKNYNQFVHYIQTHGLPQFVALDHDLSDIDYEDPTENEPEMIFSERNGYDCAKWLVNYCIEHHLKFPEYIAHSMNPIGRENIIKYIDNAKKHCPELN